MATQAEQYQATLEQIALWAQACAPPELDDGELQACTSKAQLAVVWEANTAYEVGAVVTPQPPNGSTYICTTAGTSDATAPGWPAAVTGSGGCGCSSAATVNDGTCVWQAYGTYRGVFDVARGIAAAWQLKAAKAANLVAQSSAGQNYAMQTVFEQCQRMAHAWQPFHAA